MTIDHWKQALVSLKTSIREAIQMIEDSGLQIALVVDEDHCLMGIVTDGDIRRGILKGLPLDFSVSHIMNTNPTISRGFAGREEILAIMKYKKIRHIPIVDEDGRVVNLETSDELVSITELDNWVVLMAGGMGTRLHPLTYDCPKPLLKIGDRPILETILDNIKSYGFRNFFISVNYRAEMIEEYFGDGSKWGVNIRYLRENKPLGTAGALSLLPETPKSPVLVMNGDLLTKVNFKQLLEFHLDHRSFGTMCVRDYEHQVPYGVVNLDKHRLLGIAEKPIQRYFVSAGIYMLNSQALDYIPRDTFFDMPSLFEKLIDDQQETSVYPIREYWLDIGQMNDFDKANLEFSQLFQ